MNRREKSERGRVREMVKEKQMKQQKGDEEESVSGRLRGCEERWK